MQISGLLSVISTALSLVLSLWLFINTGSNNRQQSDVMRASQEINTQNQELQLQQQTLQGQQQVINTATALQEKLGPAVIQELGAVGLKTQNARILALLAKYGVTVKENPDAKAGSPIGNGPGTGTTPR